jgi:hypothetical protein
MTDKILGSEPDSPIWMALKAQRPKAKDMLIVTAVSIAPVIIAVLIQKPALRQAIVMRTLHTTKEFCQEMADFWQKLANKSAQGYQKVQL